MHDDGFQHGGDAERWRVLVVAAVLHTRDRDAGSLRLWRILETLVEAGHRVTVVGRDGVTPELVTPELAGLGLEVFPVDRSRMRERGAQSGGPDLDFPALLSDGRFDLAWLSTAGVAQQYLPLIRSSSPLTRLIVDVAGGDCASGRARDICAAADALVAASDADAAVLSDLAADVPVHVIGAGSALPTSLGALLQATVRTAFLAPASTPGAGRAIDVFTTAFSPGDPVSLILTVPDDEPDAAGVAFAEAARTLAELGRDPDDVADVQIFASRPDVVLPGRAVIVGDDALPRSVSARESPERWRELARMSEPRTRPLRRPRAAILLHAPDDPIALEPQLAALRQARLPDDIEVVIAADPAGAPMESLLRRAQGVRVVRGSEPLGRHQAWQMAAHATRAPRAVALAPLAIPAPGFLDPLIDLVDEGAALAAPMIGGAAGLSVAVDGSLWPRAVDSPGGPDALALDCLACRSDLFRDGMPVFPRGEGHIETQLAAWAAQRGSLAVSPDSHLERLAPPGATVIVCTRNRAEELPDCIALVLAAGARDVVIVDNDSTDSTAAVAAELAGRSGGIVRLVSESRGGLSHARNAGAAAARHNLLLYLDDDARVAPGWLHHLAWALARSGVVNAGGPISALWPAERPPQWPGREFEPLLSVLDLGDVERTLVVPDVVYGANWAVRRDALLAVGGFDPEFGPGPDALINGDEVSVAWRLHDRGLGGTLYSPGAAVGHRIAPDRLNEPFLLHRALAVGVEGVRHAHAVSLGGTDQLMVTAQTTAHHLLASHPMHGDLTVAAALEQITSAPGTRGHKVQTAHALGQLSATVALLGKTRMALGDLQLRIDGESLLRGVVTQAAPLPA